MDLSRICIETRLRNGWEAIDLGVLMTRVWWWPLQLSWLVPGLAVYVLVSIVYPEPAWVALLVAWWFNPLWDRFPLVLASRALFGESLKVGAVWRDWRQICKTDWFAWLTWRRFSPTRSFDMPVTVLEKLGGDVRSRRLNVLHRTSSSAAFTLTFVCLALVVTIVLSLWILASLMIPQGVQFDEMVQSFTDSNWWPRLAATTWYLGVAIMAPFYSVAGFALYISRRIELEGWDIEIRFRHLVDRVSCNKSSGSVNKRVAAWVLPLLLTVGLGTIPAPPAQAQDEPLPSTTRELSGEAAEAKRTIVEVLEGEDFNRSEMDSGWRLKQQESEGFPDWLIWLLDMLEGISDWFRPFFEFIGALFATVPYLLWVLLILVVAYLIYRFRDALAGVLGTGPKAPPPPETPEALFGLDLRKESLPDNVPAKVMALWRDGQHREAVGLLYRATLSGLIHQFSFEFYDGYTEQECVEVVQAREQGQLSGFVQRLTRVWQHLAYAHRLPPEHQVSDLCGEWPEYFERGHSREA